MLFRGGSLQLDFAYGNGDGTFSAGQQLDLDLTFGGYLADERSLGVGVHACHDGPLQSLGIVWAGLPASLPEAPFSRPGFAVLQQATPRFYGAPVPSAVTLPPAEPFGRSLMADLDGQAPLELAIAAAGDPSVASLGLVRFAPGGFQPVEGGVEFGIGGELPRQIRGIYFGRAFPPTATTPEERAIIVVHELVGPILFKVALGYAGELPRDEETAEDVVPDPEPPRH